MRDSFDSIGSPFILILAFLIVLCIYVSTSMIKNKSDVIKSDYMNKVIEAQH